MKLKKYILSASFAVCALFASAQAQEEVTETVFRPYWYGQLQGGVQETLGETSFGKLLAPNAQITVGRQFNPVWGLRLAVNGWQSKASIDFEGRHNWKWNYVSPTLDLTCDLTSLVGGYKPNRRWYFGAFAGVGANIAWDNKEANCVNDALKPFVGGQNALFDIWNGTKVRFVGHMGLNLDYAVSSRVRLGLELQANVLPDTYNSKRAKNADWYFNGLIGVKYAFGATKAKRSRMVDVAPCEPQVVEKIVERVVEKVVEVPTPVAAEPEVVEPFRRDIFFTISNTTVDKAQMGKVQQVVDYMTKYPESRVVVTGYADKGTGTLRINLRLSEQRAKAVAEALINNGIDPKRIETKSMGEDEFQPYSDPVLNRVAICIAGE